MSTLYVSDLDGTLLNNEAALSPFSRETLQALLRDGLTFTVASARSVVSMGTMLAGLALTLPVIEFNGAFISDLASGRHEIIHSLEPSIVAEVCTLLPGFGCVPFVSTFNGTDDRVYYDEIVNDGMRWYRDDRLAAHDRRWRRTDDLRAAFRDQVVCLTIIDRREVLAELDSAIREQYAKLVETHLFENAYSPGWFWLTIHDRHATKDQALAVLREAYGLTNHELVVFGDANNDLKMFQVADRAIAVANATAELKRHATDIIGANDEDSVVKFLRRDFASLKADL